MVAADASAQITELKADDHTCLTFGEAEELFDLTAAYVRDGLAGGLKVMWLSDDGLGPAVAELTRRGVAVRTAMAAGQMATAGWEGRLPSGQVFSADAAIGWLTGQIKSARQERLPGIAGCGGHELGAAAGGRGRAAHGVRAEIDGRAGRRDRIGAVPV